MLVKIVPPPGIYTEDPEYTTQLRWIDCDKVRFVQGYPEKIGGWTEFGSDTLTGTARSIKSWQQLDGVRTIGLGTEYYLYLYEGGVAYDVTPIRDSGTLGADPFTTVNGSATVTVTHTAHGAVSGDRVILGGAVIVNGITLDGTYTITYVTDDTYTVTASNVATGSGAGGGTLVTYSYTLNSGNSDATYSFGWGTYQWGKETWGDARSTSGVTLNLHYWSVDNWGEDMLAAPRDGTLYLWDASTGTSTRSTVVAAAPDQINIMGITTPDRHCVAFGAEESGTYDKLLIKWSDQGDYTNWTVDDTTSAGSTRLANGSKIVAFQKGRGQTLIWTDTDLYGMQFVGPPYTFSVQHLSSNAGCIGVNAAISVGGTAFWMDVNNFYVYDGSTSVLSCSVHDHVFENINVVQGDKVYAALNKEFHEVWWFYPSSGSTEVDKYVIFNYNEKTWAIGTLDRTVWIDRGIFEAPIAVDSSGQMYYHETGNDNVSTAIDAYIETGEFEMGEGDHLMFINRIIPDLNITSGKSLSFTVKSRKYPNAEEITKGPYTIQSNTEKVHPRIRGRQAALKFESTDTGNHWRLGIWRADMKPGGRR